MITCILLSAGISQRFGSPKALAKLDDCSVIEHIQKTLLKSLCDEIIIVLGSEADLIYPYIFKHTRIRVVYNKNFNFGQTSSIQAGVKDIKNDRNDFMLLPVDCPLVTALSINKIIEYFNAASPDIVIPSYQNKKGHPPVFHHHLIPEILNLPLNLGLNSLFVAHRPQILEIDDPGIIKSFNTLEEFQKIIPSAS